VDSGLFGIIYAVLVTVAGVIVAMLVTGDSRYWWAAGYLAVSLRLPALAPRFPVGWSGGWNGS